MVQSGTELTVEAWFHASEYADAPRPTSSTYDQDADGDEVHVMDSVILF
jgi:hypothetical protein